MILNEDQISRIKVFFETSNFRKEGAVITDLDGTAVHEFEGRTIIHRSVENGLKNIYNMGRPIVINTLRFPLSVIRTFAKDWYLISNASIPAILLNGSQLGFITKYENEFAFEQLTAFTLTTNEINIVLSGVKHLIDDHINNIILFYYPEDWKKGEIIWTPVAERLLHLQQKYTSASSVISTPINELENELMTGPVCMILLLIDMPADRLMAYQHTKPSNFITHQGVDKLFGTEQMAALLNFKLTHSIGAGDSLMDIFLKGVGLSLHIGNPSLPYTGLFDTMRLHDFIEFGDVLYQLAEMQYAAIN
jgi:hydroxymethylpyrimidine pyrophosphatase-like HAD family hydrolase